MRSTLWGTAWTYLGAATSAWCLRTASASTHAPTTTTTTTQYSIQMLMPRDESMYQREQSQPGGRGGAQQLEVEVGIGKANARWCFRYGRATVAYWCRCKQLKFTWYSNLIRKEPNSISGGCLRINWGVSVYQLGGVHLPLPLINTWV